MSKKIRRKGFSVLETIISVLLLSLAIITMIRLTAVKISEQASIDSNYSMFTADAFLSDIYRDFHNASEITSTADETTGRCKLNMELTDGTIKLYEFIPETGYCYINGVEQFLCSSMTVRSARDSLYVAIRLPNSKIMEIDIYK